LPSGGQWLLFFEGGLGLTSWNEATGFNTNPISRDIVQSVFINAGYPEAVFERDSYRSSSENSTTAGWVAGFTSNQIFINGSNKNAYRHVRAFFAF
jgi:hypothetical protein